MSTVQHLDCALLLADPGTLPAQGCTRISWDGALLQSVEPLRQAPSTPRTLLLPALANAHDHGRAFRTATIGAHGHPLESWLPYQGLLPGVDPYLNAASSFARAVRGGVAQLMVHYTRAQGGMPYVEEAHAVARAARDVGVRIGFAVALRDRNSLGLCDDASMLAALRPQIRAEVGQRLRAAPLPVAQQIALVEDVAQMVARDDSLAQHVTVQYGPTGVQWCSTPLLEAVARASSDSGRPVHMHMLETPYQRQWADQTHPKGVLHFLDDMGLLSPRLTLAHCTYARSDELALLAERGVSIAVNTSSNLSLKSGIAPLPEMLRQGCRLAMGLDGAALDEDEDALREMRLAFALHRGWGFEATFSRAQLWAFAAYNGRRSVSGAGSDGASAQVGRIAPGAPADLVLLNWDALDDDTLFDDIDPLDLLLARANASYIDQVVVCGRTVVRGGRLTTLDETALRAELLAQVRSRLAAQPELGRWRATLGELAQDLGGFYRNSSWAGCC
ncbi:MAG: amidohydrolase family protein [Candidatus Saccharibacteria bacterium]|nr:amidohydrolase family protein [Rhodoferax sp.]